LLVFASLLSPAAALLLRCPHAVERSPSTRAAVHLCAAPLTATAKRADGHVAYAAATPEVAARALANVPADAGTAPASPAPAASSEANDAFSMLDVRVGRIVEAWEHPDSDKLWCEKIDVGEESPREIASGLRAHYATADLLTNRNVLVVCNLKPAKLAGFSSQGMVLCASSEDGETVAFVEPPEGSAVGERVLEEGAEAVEPASPNKVQKKKIMRDAADALRAVGTVATFAGTPLVTSAGACKSPSVETGTIS